jgi:hypothetical protein
MPGLVLASAFGVGLASGATSLADVAATWKGGAGSWTSQNWSTGVYPNDVNGTVYDVFIDGGNATSSSVTLGSSSIGLGSLQIDVEDTLTIGSGGGLGTAALNLAGTITVQSGGQFIAGSSGSQLTLAPTGQLVVNGGALTTGAGTLVLAGNQSLVLENGGSANLAALDTSGHTLSVPASTSLSVTSLTNSSGTVAVTGGAFTVAAMTNGGTIALSGNTTGNSTFFNAYGSAIENNAGGTIRLSDSASYAFTDSISFSGGTLASSGTGAFSATGSFSYMAPMLKDFTLAGTLNMGYYSGLGGSIVNNGTLNINSQVTGSNLMLSGTGTTYINGGSVSAVSNASNVKGYGSFGVGQNHGTIESTIQPGYTYGSLGLTGNSVTNASDGVLLVDPGASMTSYTPNFTSTGQIIVQPGGTFHVSTPTAGTGQSTIASIQNNGTVLITANLNVDSIKGGDVNVQYFAKATAGSFDVHSISVDGTSILTLRPQAAGNGGSTAPLPPTSNFVAGSLSPASTNVTTRIDVTNRDLLVAYGAAQPDPGPAIRNLLIQGYNDAAYFTNGAWNLNGLTSSYAAANHATAVGYADSADGVVGGLAADDLLVRYTLYGDLNLDGRVDAADLMLFAPHYGAVDPAWDAGDLNYDGVVNEADFKLFASNYGESLGGPLQLSAADHSALTDFADSHGLAGDLPVPEPATVLLFGTLSCCLLMYRPRRRADSVLRPNG